MAAADQCGGGRRRFAVACGVLSRCVKIVSAAANNHPATTASTMLLMPGADVVLDVREKEEEEEAVCGDERRASTQAYLTIMYSRRVLVFDEFPAESAAELVRRAGLEDAQHGGSNGLADLPVARKGSLQRFMEKRARGDGAVLRDEDGETPSAGS